MFSAKFTEKQLEPYWSFAMGALQ